MKKRLLSLVLVFCMTLSILTPAFALEVKDVSNNFWGIEAIQNLNELGIIKGYNDGYFRPNNPITRVEFFALINRAFGFERTDLAREFKDIDYIKTDWKTLEIMKASSQGFLQGTDGQANPDNKITRQEAFVILSRVLKLDLNSEKTNFADDTKISNWAKKELHALWEYGYINGTNNKINPQNHLTRAEAAQVIYNALGLLINSSKIIDGKNIEYNNLTISANGVILKNAVINGNLYITEGVGTGNVLLDNVVVKGRVLISGGGSSNASNIKLKNAKIANLVVNVPAKELVRIELSEISNIKTVNLLSNVIFVLSQSATVELLNVNSPSTIEGVGKIITAYVNTNGVSFAKSPDNIISKDGINVAINENKPSTNPTEPSDNDDGGIIDDREKSFASALETIDKQSYSPNKFTAKPLVILMDFPNYKYTELDSKEPWRINAFTGEETTSEFYDSLFFGDDFYVTNDRNKHITVNKFFMEESGGTYEFKGDVFGWYTAKNNIEYYGYNDPDHWGGSDQRRANWLVKEAIETMIKNNPDLDLSQYDVEDKWDIDADGNYDEPDGIIDTVVVIHAGLGEEWGGGSIGEDAIWPFRIGFSWYDNDLNLNDPVDAAKLIIEDENGNTPAYKFEDNSGKTWFAEDFTVFEQDLPLDLFIHEYGHVLGLPDLYASNGTPPVENWSIMGGSYSGDPRGSEPTSYGALCKKILQEDFEKRGRNYAKWQNSLEINIEDIGKNGLDIILDQASLKGKNNDSVIINLPKKEGNQITVPTGDYAYFSDNRDNMENYMYLKYGLNLSAITSSVSAITLSFDAWWSLDPGFDFFAVQIKEKDTDKWITLKDTTGHTTNKVDDWLYANETPEQILDRNPGWAITNDSGDEWLKVEFDLSEFIGKEIELRFRIKTDGNTPEDGIYLDNISIKNHESILIEDNAEGDPKFELESFLISNGYEPSTDHYYILEWRNSGAETLVDKGLQTINIGRPTLEYDPGLVIWYINDKYGGRWVDQNNWNHKNEQYASIIDADQNPVWYKYSTKNSEGPDQVNYQMHDAAFSLKTGSKLLVNGAGGNDKWTVTDNNLFMNPMFSDSNDYTSSKTGKYWMGVSLVEYGLKMFVTDESHDRSTGKIHIALDNGSNNPIVQKQTIINSINLNNKSVVVNTDKRYSENAFVEFVGKDGSTKQCVLSYNNGRYSADAEFLAEDNNWQIKFVILEDATGNSKAIYNISVNGIFGVDFGKLIK